LTFIIFSEIDIFQTGILLFWKRVQKRRIRH